MAQDIVAREVLRLLGQGLSIQQIALRLKISEAEVYAAVVRLAADKDKG